ncbi:MULTISPECIES: carbon-nitrogen family hydrolase [Streptomyces]|uniref:carbon-nitrogen family hydrolase n=1 Tax=Streptomyces TaxID=1883 RepID=UPI00085196F6|nr:MULTISPECIES: carbon-nitrogen family hydrolase [unclassified Streptomyces]MDQ0697262.1 putative amidohydrolase [Streptomyces sp. W4I9-2]MDX3486117.1 carbon-nitrogen family hydrolase [Streptomyces sp. ID05-18]
MRASLIQIAVDPDESVEDRRVRAASLVVAQQGADLVILPELWPVGAFAYTAFEAEAEPLEGPTHEVMAKAAAEAGTWLHAGSFVERAADGTLYNTSLVFSPQGERTAVYRKIHRFGFDKGEAVMMGAGEELVTVALPDTTLGLATCYDLRFPEQFRGLVDAGAEALVVVAGWPERRRAHWTLLAQARAVENQAYVLAVGTAGTHGDIQQAGHSIVVDPWGEVLAQAGADEEILTVELDADKVRATREQFPALKDRRLGLAPPL